MTLDNILELWKEDSKIDEVHLDNASIKSASLHSKYLELYSLSKLRLKKKDYELAVLKKDKWLYYNGKMPKEDMDSRGWPYDPFNGLAKPLKSEMDIYFDTDPDISKLKMVMEYQQTIVETLKDILDNVRWRHTTIKNIIDFRRFTAGT
jgi:hypothetical protein